jgi:hypothetical protein
MKNSTLSVNVLHLYGISMKWTVWVSGVGYKLRRCFVATNMQIFDLRWQRVALIRWSSYIFDCFCWTICSVIASPMIGTGGRWWGRSTSCPLTGNPINWSVSIECGSIVQRTLGNNRRRTLKKCKALIRGVASVSKSTYSAENGRESQCCHWGTLNPIQWIIGIQPSSLRRWTELGWYL